ncbi:MAG: ROK family protein [Anaerolineales bacterium]|nr:ROK family protein [Anaerolineales bacterium]
MTGEPIYIGIDLGGTFVRVGAIDGQGNLLVADQSPIEARRGPQVGLAHIIALIETTLERLAAQGGRFHLAGIGFGSTGPVYPETGIIDNPYTLPTWENVSIFEPLQARFGVPLTLENDADVAALGEYWMGVGRGVKRLYAITVGTGIGAAFILDGRIYRGVTGAHPDGGHQVIDPNGPQCYCGLRGCWESLASGPAIARQAQARIDEYPHSLLLELAGGDAARIDARMTAQAAAAGDPLAAAVMERAAWHFSLGVANIIILFLPDVIVLSGGVMESIDLFKPALDRMTAAIDVMVPASQVRIVPAQLGYHAGLYGAAYSVMQKVNGSPV